MALNERIVPILSLHQPQVLRLSRRTPLQGSGHQPHRLRLIAGLLFTATSLPSVFSEASAAPITVIDQQNLGPEMGSQGGVIFGQSFIPTLPRVDAFEAVMGDFGATVVAQILNGVVGFDGLAGPVIGTSDPAVTEIIGRHTVHFDFPFGVTVTPGETYVARFFSTNGDFAPGIAGVSITTNDSYTQGLLLEGGVPPGFFSPDYDLIFSEGLTTPIPEAPPSWVVSLCFLSLFQRQNLKSCDLSFQTG
jgi:hypothetical protein